MKIILILSDLLTTDFLRKKSRGTDRFGLFTVPELARQY